ncbi:hypothetical protein J3Q64DRAFT_1809830 [Phycomyces blakesleeanus]|uniref:MPN domain-containing protein n=1 Tax=Phycomyces blakesleeanus TaxID=4837 RepID=A0ABR3AX98_PHYBL
MTELPNHPQYNDPKYKKNKRSIIQNCLDALDILENIKPILQEQYDEYINEQHAIQEQEQEREQEREELASQNQYHTRQIQPQPQPQSYHHHHHQQQQQQQQQQQPTSDWSLQEALKGVQGVGFTTYYPSDSVHGQTIDYPHSLQRNQSDGFHYQVNSSPLFVPVTHTPLPSAPPLPPKESAYAHQSSPHLYSHPPTLPPKVPLEPKNEPILPPKIPDKPTESHSPIACTERGEPLRKMRLPHVLQEQFLSLARPNTLKNIETCGILAGNLKNNVLTITTLILPKQTGTSDTCSTENEEDLFEFQNKHDLLTFGWIHANETHPTQSCFLSSVDLHTHCSYQLMLPEAIAIVCSPSQTPNFGIFRLTDPPGLDIISTCRAERAFHTHPDKPIYTDASDTGFIEMINFDVNVVDLR